MAGQFGMQAILFALEEPHLYQLLFMQGDGQPHTFEEVFAGFGESARVCIDILHREYGLPEAADASPDAEAVTDYCISSVKIETHRQTVES